MQRFNVGITLGLGLVALLALTLGLALFASGSPARATGVGGPVILGGDDLTDHGSRDTINNLNLTGWLYIQRALENIGPQVTRAGHDGSVAVLGSADSTTTFGNAGAAYHYAVPDAGLATAKLSGVASFYEGAAAINTFFTDLAAGTVNPAIIVTVGTGALNDLDTTEGTALTNNAIAIAGFVNSGGGLLSHGAGTVAYGWLSTLIPGATFPPGCDSTTLTLTLAGQAAFPGLTNANIRSGPCHNQFLNHGLTVLASDGAAREIIIGGSKVILPGNITLSPANDKNLVGQTHTVTAFAEDGDPLIPAVGVLVTFQVTTGPNNGEVSDPGECSPNANCTTDANGNVSWTYAGSGGVGTDTIVASFVDTGGQTQSDSAQKTWNEPTPTATPTVTDTPTPTPTPTATTPASSLPKLPDPSIVGYWQFDEGSGGTAFDSSSYGNDGTLANGPVWTAGVLGDALQLDGVNDRVRVEHAPSLDIGGPFTLMAWVNPDSDVGCFESFINRIPTYTLQTCTGNALRLYTSGRAVNSPQGVLVPNTWQHVAGTFDGATIRLYKNGVEVASQAFAPFTPTTASVPLFIGMELASGPREWEFFGGRIDEVKVYNRALTSAEIAQRADISSKVLGIPHQGLIFPLAGGETSPSLNEPQGVLYAPDGTVYYSEALGCRVWKVTPTGTASLFAGTGVCGYGGDGGQATLAQLDGPVDLAIDSLRNVYIADRVNHRIRKVAPGGIISTFAGNGTVGFSGDGGPATAAQLSSPPGLWVDSSDNVYIGDWDNRRVRLVNGAGTITTVAGNGSATGCADGTSATGPCLNRVWDIVGDNAGSLYIVDNWGHSVKRVTGGLIYFITGTDLFFPAGIDIDAAGDLYVASSNHKVQKISGGTVTTVAGNGTSGYCGDGGPATSACLNAPAGLDVSPNGDLFIASKRIRVVVDGIIDTFAGSPNYCGEAFVALDSCLDEPAGLTVNPNNGDLYLVDAVNNRVRRVDFNTGAITTVAGGGTGCATLPCVSTQMMLQRPEQVAINPISGDLYISEPDHHRVYRVQASGGSNNFIVEGGEQLSIVAGDSVAGSCLDGSDSRGSCLNEPRGLAAFGTNLYIGQSGGDDRISRVDLSTLKIYEAVTGEPEAWGLALDTAGSGLGNLYVAQPGAHRLTLVQHGGDFIIGTGDTKTVVAGTGTAGGAYPVDFTVALNADLNSPRGLVVDDDGHVLFTNGGTHTIHVIEPGLNGLVDAGDQELMFRIGGGNAASPGFCGDPDPGPPVVAYPAREACLYSPFGVGWHEDTSTLYFSDEQNLRVRKIPSDCDLDGLLDKVEETVWLTDKCNPDTDGDGCGDGREVGPNEFLGGRRNPTNPYDYYDINGDRFIDLTNDIFEVIQHYAPTGTEPEYDVNFDRGPSEGPNVWDMTAPDGVIDLTNDIFGVIQQYFHSCQ